MKRLINMLTVSDEEFYFGNARSCGSEAVKFYQRGEEFLAGWYAERAASYALDFLGREE